MAGGESGKLTRRDSTKLAERDDLDDAERIARVRESTIESRRQIAESLDRIRDEVRDAVDWRGYVREHPAEAVGLAFGVGFLIGFR